MNIFWLHLVASINASFHMDKHVSKMITESLQLLYSALHLYFKRNSFLLEETPYYASLAQDWSIVIKEISDIHPSWNEYRPYKLSHVGHPCLEWVLESRQNWIKLCDLTIELCNEYSRRYYGPVGETPHGAFTTIKPIKKSPQGPAKSHGPVKSHCGYAHALLLLSHVPDFPDIGLTLPPLCMPDAARDGFCQDPEFHEDTGALKMFRAKSWEDAVKAYQKYYHHKLSFLTYTNTSTPSWIDPTMIIVQPDPEFVKIRDRHRIAFSKQVVKYRIKKMDTESKIWLFAAKECSIAKDIETIQRIASNTKRAIADLK